MDRSWPGTSIWEEHHGNNKLMTATIIIIITSINFIVENHKCKPLGSANESIKFIWMFVFAFLESIRVPIITSQETTIFGGNQIQTDLPFTHPLEDLQTPKCLRNLFHLRKWFVETLHVVSCQPDPIFPGTGKKILRDNKEVNRHTEKHIFKNCYSKVASRPRTPPQSLQHLHFSGVFSLTMPNGFREIAWISMLWCVVRGQCLFQHFWRMFQRPQLLVQQIDYAQI